MGPLLQTGYARPLEASDLWKMDDTRSSGRYARLIDESFERRQKEAAEYNAKLDSGEIRPGSVKRFWWSVRGDKERREKDWKEKSRKKARLLWALKYVMFLRFPRLLPELPRSSDAIKAWFWFGILIKAFGDTAQICSPLVVKVCMLPFAQVVMRRLNLSSTSGNHQILLQCVLSSQRLPRHSQAKYWRRSWNVYRSNGSPVVHNNFHEPKHVPNGLIGMHYPCTLVLRHD